MEWKFTEAVATTAHILHVDKDRTIPSVAALYECGATESPNIVSAITTEKHTDML